MKMSSKILIFIIFGAFIGGLFVYFFKFTANDVITESADYSRVTEVDWTQLQLLDVTTGNIKGALKLLNGKNIKIPGFIIPLEDNQDFVDEFLFVPSPMACIHVPPPPPNQIIHVKMASGKKTKMSYGPVWLFGKFIILENSNNNLKSSFEMIGSYTSPYL